MSNIVGLNPKKTRTFIPEADRNLSEDEKPLKFFVRMLTARESADLRDEIYDISGVGKKRKERLRSGTHELRVLYRCIEGWENFVDEEGNDIPFKKTHRGSEPLIENLDYLSNEVITEIARFVSRDNDIEEEEEGNSDSPSDGRSGIALAK